MNSTHIDIAGYALHAVDELEQARAERHLRDCEQCREEVAEMQEVTAMLALDTPQVTPSAGLRTTLLDQIQVTPQDSPAPVASATRPASAGRARRAVLGLVAAAAIVVGGVGVAKVAPWSNSPSGVTNAATRIAKAPDAVSKTASFRGGTVTVVMSRSLNQAVAKLDKVAAAGGTSSYQGWYIKSDGPTNAGVLKADSNTTLVPKLQGASEFDITLEPKGGSTVPTSKPILAIPMT